MFRVAAFRQVGRFSPRLWLGGEEELLAIDLAARGWWMCWAEDVVINHAPSRLRDARRRRQLGIHNTLWTAWLRRRAASALRHTGSLLRRVPPDRASAAAVAQAVAGLPWMLRERRVVPPQAEQGPAPARGAAAPLPGPPLRRLTWGGRGSAGAGLGVRGGHRLGLG
jgi:hypothetical protein